MVNVSFTDFDGKNMDVELKVHQLSSRYIREIMDDPCNGDKELAMVARKDTYGYACNKRHRDRWVRRLALQLRRRGER